MLQGSGGELSLMGGQPWWSFATCHGHNLIIHELSGMSPNYGGSKWLLYQLPHQDERKTLSDSCVLWERSFWLLHNNVFLCCPYAFCSQWSVGFVLDSLLLILPLLSHKEPSQFTCCFPGIWKTTAPQYYWQLRIYTQPLVLQSGAWGAHRALLSFYNKAIRASM